MLEIKNISAGYGAKTVLHGASASFEKGRFTCVIGANGCGKSTLLKAILGILPLREGEIVMDGADMRSMSRNDIAKKAAYLSQGKNTPDMTVEQMVLHGRFPYLSYPRRYRESDREMARNAMETVGISHLAKEQLDTLSGGMRQNAYIAMALAQDTDYILLDEPTTYLDIAHQLDLMRILRSLAEGGKGIIAVMHDLPLAFDFADQLAVIQDGTVAAEGTPMELCGSPVIEEIFGVRLMPMENGRFYCRYGK